MFYIFTGSVSILIFTIPIVDSFYYNDGIKKYILVGTGLFVYVYSLKDFPLESIANNLIIFILICGFLQYLKYTQNEILRLEEQAEEEKHKASALLESVRNLEMYNESIEDLIMLKERNRISREIHDSVGHGLSTIIIQLNALFALAKAKSDLLPEKITDLNNFAKKNLEEVRFALRELKPADYNKYESVLLIHNLINEFKKMTNINVQLTFSKTIWSLSDAQNHVLYKSVQEFLSNSAKHGSPTKITIHLSFAETVLILTMSDNGAGCMEIKKGIGLKAIEERIAEVGGAIQYKSLPSVEGFFMRLSFPRVEKNIL
ncbi:sensor histidine kinase [Treponema phagedenis]|uniref:sensor histidine kinase n=1 Tax=Treponema phagedenis TaxID=162 RepID=UPI001E404BD1|nr:sensor histidine kinase [Treponema phagedenis]